MNEVNNAKYSHPFNQKEEQLVIKEKGYGGELATLGKIACFLEKIYNLELTEEDIKHIIPLENPTMEESFKEGYKYGLALIANGFNQKNFKDFLEKQSKNTKNKLEKIQIINSAKHR